MLQHALAQWQIKRGFKGFAQIIPAAKLFYILFQKRIQEILCEIRQTNTSFMNFNPLVRSDTNSTIDNSNYE